MSLKFIKTCPHLRNGLVRPVFALYVITGGHVPTESGRRQTARGGGKELVHKERFRTGSGLLARTRRANGVDRQEEGSLPSATKN